MKEEDKMKKFALHLLVLCIVLIAIPLGAEKVSVLTEVNKPETIQFGSGNIYILEGTTVYIYDEVTYKYKGKFGKEGTVIGFFNMGFESQITFTFGEAKNRIKDAQQLKVTFFIIFAAFKNLTKGAGNTRNNSFWVANNKLAEGRPPDNYKFKGLPKHIHVSAGTNISADHAAKNEHKTNDKKH